MKKQKKSGSECYNYKGFFSLVLLALVDTKYRFLWVDVGPSGSSSNAHIFHHSKLRKKIYDDTLGFQPEPLADGGPDLHYSLLGDGTSPRYCSLLNPTAEDNSRIKQTIGSPEAGRLWRMRLESW